ncbi:TetR/AcrR family transcriptional regulator [Paenibacillus sp. KQZ6P-2]|uniref:TetR/AcrR family transcriptional regulator n=1 Tax=Paenibacillus mangrovi TaxID=2931978 RepID=A0A9X2B7A3_9BACL|nr:TetR/AcrR family transcriptional regulator [Paenibacillus mangrovi]MCJ8014732.1 TetR/AcrR family transcriptional regulator [Paenibacillus mangrovi]
MKYKTGEETKMKIIDSAFQLLAEKGYDAMSIDDIMKGAGKTKGSFYVHFKNKEDLLYEVIQMRLDRDLDHIVEETFKELSNETCNVQLILKQLMHQVHLGSGGVDRELWTAAHYQMVVLSRKNQIVREWMSKQYHAWSDFITKIITRGQDLGQIRTDIDILVMVNMLISLLEGYELRSIVDPDIDVYEQLKLTELFCTNQP